MIDVRKVLKVCEQQDGFVLYFTAHKGADYNPIRKPQEGDYCTPYFFRTDTLEESIKQRDSLISVFDRAEEANIVGEPVEDQESPDLSHLQLIKKTSPVPIHLKQPPGENANAKASATALLEMTYPAKVKDRMREAFTSGEYQDVLEIAANHDLVTRESLDHKIKQIPNPDFKLIKGNVIEMTEENEEEDTKQVAPYLFQAEGIERTFTSATAAISAYKEKHNIKTPDTTKHKIRKNHVQAEDREVPALVTEKEES